MIAGEIDYFPVAKEYEKVFRNILRDLKENRRSRPMGIFIPEDLKTEIPLEELFQTYSPGCCDDFCIANFEIEKIDNEESALIYFYKLGILSGGGACLKYAVKNSQVAYQNIEWTERS